MPTTREQLVLVGEADLARRRRIKLGWSACEKEGLGKDREFIRAQILVAQVGTDRRHVDNTGEERHLGGLPVDVEMDPLDPDPAHDGVPDVRLPCNQKPAQPLEELGLFRFLIDFRCTEPGCALRRQQAGKEHHLVVAQPTDLGHDAQWNSVPLEGRRTEIAILLPAPDVTRVRGTV